MKAKVTAHTQFVIKELETLLKGGNAPHHKSPEWPDDYWSKSPGPPDKKAWKNTLDQIGKDRKAYVALLHAAGEDIYTPFPHGDGQSLFREALVIADHNSYHSGEILVLRRLLGIWK